MPVAVVVGGQYGSEGKGKIAHWLAARIGAQIAIRVGGANSGHSVVLDSGLRTVLRQVPTPALIDGVTAVIAPGSYIDKRVLLSEIEHLQLRPDRLLVDPHAVMISDSARSLETESNLGDAIGSTLSGTGGAVIERTRRTGPIVFARDDPQLRPWVRATVPWVRRALQKQARVIVEGTQGYGLSVLHSDDWPYVTSRDTTAAGALAEAGLSPVDVDMVYMVIRSHPIRVAGHSGPLFGETTWEQLRISGGHDHSLEERTSVTKRVRRVGQFHAPTVQAAIATNNPTHLVLNHLDYLDHWACLSGQPSPTILSFVERLESAIRRHIDFFGLSPVGLLDRTDMGLAAVRRIV